MLTLETLESSLFFVLISYIIAFAFQIYMMYLNYKQSKVNNQMFELLQEVKEINKKLTNNKKK
jgi:hypothetical protein